MKRILSLLMLALLVGSISAQNCNQQVNTNILAASAAVPDSAYTQQTEAQAVFINSTIANTAKRYNFINNGIVAGNGGNNLYINGILTPADGSDGNYNARFAFNKLSSAPTDVKKELNENAYKEAGGPIDTSTWTYYQIDPSNSELQGTGSANGNNIQLIEHPGTALQYGTGASGKNTANGLSGWFLMNVSTPSGNSVTTDMEVLDINVNLGCESDFNCVNYALSAAIINPSQTSQTNSNQALFVASDSIGFFGGNTQYDIATGNNSLIFDSNGNALVSLTVLAKGATESSSNVLTCSLSYTPTAAPSNPKQELNSDQYIPQGSVNPFSWAFYNIDTGASSCSFSNGSTIRNLGLQDDMPMQLGVGASGKNTNFGLASWVKFEGGYFDINLDANCNDNTNLGSESPTTTPPVTSTPQETCPAGCQPIPLPTTAPTETPAGNNAANVEISKLLLAVMSLFILAFFH